MPARKRTGHWLAGHHRDLLEGVGRFLDADAGLREVMMHGEHADMLGALGASLDIGAGLAAIIASRGAAATRPGANPAHAKSSLPGPADVAAAIAASDPTVLMTLRHNPL